MSYDKMGGPAFPSPAAAHPGAHPPNEPKGMALWDYYATAALQGLVALGQHDCTPTEIAYDAAIYADAMLAERNRRMEAEE